MHLTIHWCRYSTTEYVYRRITDICPRFLQQTFRVKYKASALHNCTNFLLYCTVLLESIWHGNSMRDTVLFVHLLYNFAVDCLATFRQRNFVPCPRGFLLETSVCCPPPYSFGDEEHPTVFRVIMFEAHVRASTAHWCPYHWPIQNSVCLFSKYARSTCPNPQALPMFFSQSTAVTKSFVWFHINARLLEHFHNMALILMTKTLISYLQYFRLRC